jgi:cytochrome c peroxidase
MKRIGYLWAACVALFVVAALASVSAGGRDDDRHDSGHHDGDHRNDGRQLFDRETFGGNGRTCVTCHSRETGTVSPQDARQRLRGNRRDPLFLHDGSDDGQGHGVSRMLKDATILVEVPLPPNVSLGDDPDARSVVLRRGVPTTLNTPALDPVLMFDGRQPTLEAQAIGAIHDHAQAVAFPTAAELKRLADFELTDRFFSSPELRRFAGGGPAPTLPAGRTAAERRGRRFFEDVTDFADLKHGLCAGCHSGPMLNETNLTLTAISGVPPHSRFQSVLVAELNAAHNPVHDFVFTNPDNTTTHVVSADPGRALITGIGQETGRFDQVNAFKIPSLWGITRTAPYFHDNSAKTLADVAAHYATFFSIATDADGPGPNPPLVTLTPRDQADIVAYMKLLD